MGLDLPTNNQELENLALRISSLTTKDQLQFLDLVLSKLPLESQQEWQQQTNSIIDSQQDPTPIDEQQPRQPDPNSFTFIISDNSNSANLTHDSPELRRFMDNLAQTIFDYLPRTSTQQTSGLTDDEQRIMNIRNITRRTRDRLRNPNSNSNPRPQQQQHPYRRNSFWGPNGPRDAQN